MTPHRPDEPFTSLFDDPELEAVFATSSPAETLAAVLTEARVVLAEVEGPLDAELWGSDIVAALGSGGGQADAIVAAAERAGTREALATLRVLGAVGSGALRAEARDAAGRLAALGITPPAWAESMGAPSPGQCWCYGDRRGRLEAVTMTFWYADRGHVVSVLLDRDQGGGIKNVWIGDSAGVLDRTRQMARQDPGMLFEMITQPDARARMERALAAGECPRQPEEAGNVASRRAILRARVALLAGGSG
ncbi:MAG TPA: hypothetical protein VMI33_21185 [Streptosporangiaceae bacterium]|nr:hypothetical protein [Streptosporangiaceae bacterium]